MMPPDQEAEHRDRHARKRDEVIAENLFARKGAHQLADHAHGGKHHDVNRRMRVEPEQMLEQHRIAAAVGIENAQSENPLDGQQQNGHRQHRRAQHHDQAGGIHGPDEQRKPEPGETRGAHAVNGHDEIQPGHDGRKTDDENANAGGDDVGVGVGRAERRVEGPAGIESAHQHGVHRKQAADHEDVPAAQIDFGKRQILGAQHDRHQKISQRGGDGRDQEQEHHDDAVQREQLVISVRGNQVALGSEQLQANQGGERSAEKEEKRDGHQIHQRDAFMILRKQPALDAVIDVQVIFASFKCCRNHMCLPFSPDWRGRCGRRRAARPTS